MQPVGKDARREALQELEDPLAAAERLAPRIEAGAAENERLRGLSPEIFQLLLNAGLYRMLLPRSLGGHELAPSQFSRVLERVARADGSTAWCLGQTGGCATAAARLPPRVAAEVFGPARAVMAWGAGPKGQAVPVAGGYELTGAWPFASGSRQANWLGAHVHICGPDGKPRPGADGKPQVLTLLFPATEATVTDVWRVMGLKATGSDTYAVERLFVPAERTFPREGDPHPSQPGILFRFPVTLIYAGGFGGVALGLAVGMLQALISLASEKVPHRSASALRESPVIQMMVAQAEATLGSARAYLWHSLEEIEDSLRGDDRARLTPAQRMRIRLAATHAILQAKQAADIVYRAAGSTSIFEESAFERRFRDLHTVTQQIQARHTQLETVGQFLLGLNPDPASY